MLKYILCFLVCFFIIASPAIADLTAQDLKEIRLIVKEEITGVEKQIAGVEKQITMVANFVYALIALIVLAVGIPQIIMVWRDRRDSTLEAQIAALTQEVEKLKQQIVNP